MEHILIYAALGISLFTACLHLFAGSPEFAKPLWQSNALPLQIKATLWMCWHMVSLSLFVIPVLIGLGLWLGNDAYYWSALILNTAIGLAAFMSNIALKVSFKVLFQGFLFVPVTIAMFIAL